MIVSFLMLIYATSKESGPLRGSTFILFAVVFVSLVAIILLSNSIVDTQGGSFPSWGEGCHADTGRRIETAFVLRGG